jgi:hypothetical protein
MAAEIMQDGTIFVPDFTAFVTKGKILQPLSNTHLFIIYYSVSQNTQQNAKLI